MGEYLIRLVQARPFVAFTLLFHGGHGIDVLSPEFVIIEFAALHVTVYDPAGHRWYAEVDKIVAFRTIHLVEE